MQCSAVQWSRQVSSESNQVDKIMGKWSQTGLNLCIVVLQQREIATRHLSYRVHVNQTTPHHTTPNHTTPHRTTPHHTKSHHTAPHQITPHRTAPHHTTPNHIASHHSTSHHTTAHHTCRVISHLSWNANEKDASSSTASTTTSLSIALMRDWTNEARFALYRNLSTNSLKLGI